jgi:hypothetical protein
MPRSQKTQDDQYSDRFRMPMMVERQATAIAAEPFSSDDKPQEALQTPKVSAPAMLPAPVDAVATIPAIGEVLDNPPLMLASSTSGMGRIVGAVLAVLGVAAIGAVAAADWFQRQPQRVIEASGRSAPSSAMDAIEQRFVVVPGPASSPVSARPTWPLAILPTAIDATAPVRPQSNMSVNVPLPPRRPIASGPSPKTRATAASPASKKEHQKPVGPAGSPQ